MPDHMLCAFEDKYTDGENLIDDAMFWWVQTSKRTEAIQRLLNDPAAAAQIKSSGLHQTPKTHPASPWVPGTE